MAFFPKKIPPVEQNDWRFSIVIPTWNNLPYLKLLIDSLRRNSQFRHQIILFINDGSDGTLNWAELQDDVHFIHSPENVGICYALNACRGLVKTSYFAYFNDDMYACPGWDAALWQAIEMAGSTKFFFSSTMIEPTETANPCVVVQDFGSTLNDFREQDLLQNFQKIHLPDWQGATWPPNVVSVDLWDLVGGYSVEFSPGMYSDPDFSMKLWRAGVRLFKGIGTSRVYHFGAKSTGRLKRNSAGKQLFRKKWGVSSSIFTQQFLRRGQLFDGQLPTPTLSFWGKVKRKCLR